MDDDHRRGLRALGRAQALELCLTSDEADSRVHR
jgi:hypothetical protein